MIPIENLKTWKDITELSFEELKDIYCQLNSTAKDEWRPIMYVYDECPHCNGEAHLFENFKQEYLQVRCFNDTCKYYGKIIEQFYKLEDYYQTIISIELGIKQDEKEIPS